MRIVFMGSPQFAVPSLEKLCKSQHEVLAVVTQPDRPKGRSLQTHPPHVKVAAERFGIPVLQPATTRSETFFSELSSLRPDLLVVVAYGEILRKNILSLPIFGAVNLHASLLPRYRGAAPIAWAILQGDSITGATTMKMNQTMDAGPILLQQKCEISERDTTETLSNSISILGADLLTQTIDLLEKKEITPIEQNPDEVSFAPKLRKEDGRIDWTQNALRISRQIRAFTPWPGSFSSFRNTTVKLWLAEPAKGSAQEEPGTVIEVKNNSFRVACGERSTLDVFELQLENRRRSPAADFIHGYSLHAGDRFESTNESDNINSL